MATKAKTAPTPKAALPADQAAAPSATSAFAHALGLFEAGNHGEAAKALEAAMLAAQETGEWAVKRRAQIYLGLAQAKQNPAKAVKPTNLVEIQASLNRRNTEEAMKLIDKELKDHPTLAVAHYLRSLAFAQTDNAEASADSLKRALELDPDLVFQWHMDPDFNGIRKSTLFAFTENR